jgi:endonuclease/exonuclease/phosphatase (EEP) superfamily protein YafD
MQAMTTTRPSPLTAARRLLLALLVCGASLAVADGASGNDLGEEARACAAQLGQLPVAEGELLAPPFDIVSWNIHKSVHADWATDLLAIAGDSQLTFLQEASPESRPGELRPTGPLYQSFAEGYVTDTQRTGVMTLSTSAPAMQCNFSRVEPWLGTRKAATVTEHVLSGHAERLLSINLHAVNFTFGLLDLQQQLQPIELLLSRHRGPAILAGDFNTWSEARQRLVDRLLSRYGLQPLRFEPDLRTRVLGRPLDHIYVRGLVAEHTEVIPVRSSDHNALRARLSLLL